MASTPTFAHGSEQCFYQEPPLSGWSYEKQTEIRTYVYRSPRRSKYPRHIMSKRGGRAITVLRAV
eukprot:2837829-Lingulodinium_polyedra.AAC.1